MKEIIRPISIGDNYGDKILDDGMAYILWPGAFCWYANKLYVGYSWLSRLHETEEPLWDPEPISVGSVIHAHRGYYHFAEELTAPGRYRRRFAVMRFVHMHREEDMERYEMGVGGRCIPPTQRDSIIIREQFVLDPHECIRHQRTGNNLKNRFGGNTRARVRRIKSMPSLHRMRNVEPALREEMEYFYPTGFEDEIARIMAGDTNASA